MKIIDFERKGNVVRFYFGEDDLGKWWGDDWDDTPYEHNAGRVYDEYISEWVDMAFPFDWYVCEPCDGELNSRFCKNDMVKRKCPCIIAVPPSELKDNWFPNYKDFVGSQNGAIEKYYFGDTKRSIDLFFKIAEGKGTGELE